MILYVEKIHTIEIQQLVMASLGDIKIHHGAPWANLGAILFIIQTLILTIHYEKIF